MLYALSLVELSLFLFMDTSPQSPFPRRGPRRTPYTHQSNQRPSPAKPRQFSREPARPQSPSRFSPHLPSPKPYPQSQGTPQPTPDHREPARPQHENTRNRFSHAQSTPRHLPSHNRFPAGRSGGSRRPAGRGRAGGESPLKAATGVVKTVKRRPDSERLIDGGNPDAVRFVAVGGFEEVGRNMMFFEYKDEIVIIDAGLGFADEETPGVDYIIPNTEYLEQKKQHIRGMIMTHGHLDHIGALPFIIEKLGNPIIYATTLTKSLIEKRHEEFPNLPKLRFGVIKNRDRVRLGQHFEAEFFGVAHNIPDTTGVALKTPVGNIVHFADFKIDYDAHNQPQGLEEFAEIGAMGIHTLLLDSTNSTKSGRSISERVVEQNLEDIFKRAEGRVIMATFSSMISRIAEVIKIAEKLGRRVFLNGFSMKNNIQIAQNLGIIKPQQGTILPIEELPKYRDEKVLVITTGGQGEQNAGLSKMVNGEHKVVSIKEGDLVVFSASVIPGNERDLQVLQDNLCRQGAVVMKSNEMDIHSSGHAPKEDLKMVMEIMKPKYFIPCHGYYFMRAANAQIGWEAGIPKDRTILSDNGLIVEITPETVRITKQSIPSSFVMVDGLGVGDVEEVVLRDRKNLSEEGMLITIVTLSRQTGRILKNPDIISRGFIHLKNNQQFVEDMREKTKLIMEKMAHGTQPEAEYVRTLLREQLGQYIFTKTQRRPMIIPVVIEV